MTRAAAPPRPEPPMSRRDAAAPPGRPGGLAVVLAGGVRPGERVVERLRLVNAAWLSILAALALSLLGVYAIDVARAVEPAARDLDPTAWRQIVFLAVGMLAALMVALPHYRFIGWLAWPLYALCVGVLVFMLVPFVPEAIVRPRNGARAWINLGFTDFQPAEVMKIAYVLAVARYLRFRTQHRRFRGLLVPGLITFVPVALITLQPDLGTSSLFAPTLFGVLIAAGARLRHLTIIVACAAFAAPLSYPLLAPHQKARIVGLVQQIRGDSTLDQSINFQPETAQRLIGAGRLEGLGDEAARVLVHYNRLPERHNDMIFSVIVTRFGFLGGVGVMTLYLVWVGGALAVAATCRDPYGRLLAVGSAGFIAAQMFVNIGMNIGLLPIIGVTLPFLSAGGSSMLTVWIFTGLLINVALHRPRPPYRTSFEWYEDEDGVERAATPWGRKAAWHGRAWTR